MQSGYGDVTRHPYSTNGTGFIPDLNLYRVAVKLPRRILQSETGPRFAAADNKSTMYLNLPQCFRKKALQARCVSYLHHGNPVLGDPDDL